MRARRNVNVERVWSELGVLMDQVISSERTCEATRVVELVYRLCTCEPPQSDALKERVHQLVATHCARVATRVSSLSAYATEWSRFTKGASALNALCSHLNAELRLTLTDLPFGHHHHHSHHHHHHDSYSSLASSPVGLDALNLWHSAVFFAFGSDAGGRGRRGGEKYSRRICCWLGCHGRIDSFGGLCRESLRARCRAHGARRQVAVQSRV
jgi:hypothetical protein